jgi:hypothetical protein
MPVQVEDDETPEMIMAKFLELERIEKDAQESRKAAEVAGSEAGQSPGGEGEQAEPQAEAAGAEGSDAQMLSDEQLLQVFKQVCALALWALCVWGE